MIIRTKQDLRIFINKDEAANCFTKYNKNNPFKCFTNKHSLHKYLIRLRKMEYHFNNNHKFRFLIHKFLNNKYQLRNHMYIPINTLGPGCVFPHPVGIIISENSRIGENAIIHQYVTIGNNGFVDKSPTIGDNCFVGAHCTIIGDISIGNKCTIGAGAVVITNMPDLSICGGVPAKVISYKKENYNE